MRSWICCAALLLPLASWAAEPAMQPDAKEHLDKGLRSFAVQNYKEAIDEYKIGYEIDPAPDFLYAIAQAQRLSGDCAKAVLSYQSFLRTHPPERRAEPARLNMQRCKDELAQGTVPVDTNAADAGTEPRIQQPLDSAVPPEPVLIPPIAPPTQKAAPEPEPWYRDGVADGLLAGGLAAAIVGGVLIKVGGDGVTQANATIQSASNYQSAADAIQSGQNANREQQAGVGLVVVGCGLLGGGFLRVFLHDRGPDVSTSAMLLPHGGAAWVAAGRF